MGLSRICAASDLVLLFRSDISIEKAAQSVISEQGCEPSPSSSITLKPAARQTKPRFCFAVYLARDLFLAAYGDMKTLNIILCIVFVENSKPAARQEKFF